MEFDDGVFKIKTLNLGLGSILDTSLSSGSCRPREIIMLLGATTRANTKRGKKNPKLSVESKNGPNLKLGFFYHHRALVQSSTMAFQKKQESHAPLLNSHGNSAMVEEHEKGLKILQLLLSYFQC